MNVVIDTNIVVSAILKDRDPEAVIRFVVSHPGYQWIASGAIIAEYTAVLRRPKFSLPETIIQEWDAVFNSTITLVDVPIVVDFPRDQKDAKFMACAIAADAAFLITGDHDLTEADKLLNTTICSVAQFKQRVMATSPD